MSDKSMEQAFQRHPRPQFPTKSTLLEQNRKILDGRVVKHTTKVSNEREERKERVPDGLDSTQRPKRNAEHTIQTEIPWKTMNRLGDLVQSGQQWSICSLSGQLVMVKKLAINAGERELEKMKLLEHANIASVKEAFQNDSLIYLKYDYARFTLEEVLSVHLRLDEPCIRVVATSIFAAIKHMAAAGIVYTSISLTSVRIHGGTGMVVLSNFQDSIWQTTELTPNADLEQLAYLTLECMNGNPSESLRDPSTVRAQRKSNKIFGLEDGERWSEFKLLVDFLDELLNHEKPAIAKLDRPHRYVMQPPNYEILTPFLELIPLECFTFWRPAAAKTVDRPE